jgi:predicted ATP-grasp superfamily ATP-dependent carboligase
VYGKKRNLTHLPAELATWLKENATETFLHAKGLKFALPSSHEEVSVIANNPEKFVALMEILKRNFISEEKP